MHIFFFFYLLYVMATIFSAHFTHKFWFYWLIEEFLISAAIYTINTRCLLLGETVQECITLFGKVMHSFCFFCSTHIIMNFLK